MKEKYRDLSESHKNLLTCLKIYRDFDILFWTSFIWNLKLSSESRYNPKNLMVGFGLYLLTYSNFEFRFVLFWFELLKSRYISISSQHWIESWFLLKIMNLFFSGLRLNSLARNQSASFLSSTFNLVIISFKFSFYLPYLNRVITQPLLKYVKSGFLHFCALTPPRPLNIWTSNFQPCIPLLHRRF